MFVTNLSKLKSVYMLAHGVHLPVQILSRMKKKIDGLASCQEGMDVLVGRALRTLNGRADKLERHQEGSHRFVSADYIFCVDLYCCHTIFVVFRRSN